MVSSSHPSSALLQGSYFYHCSMSHLPLVAVAVLLCWHPRKEDLVSDSETGISLIQQPYRTRAKVTFSSPIGLS